MITIKTRQGDVFDYYSLDDLNIRLNRVVDEYNQLDTRFSEFSYQFSLPMTKNNKRIFGHVEHIDVTNKFNRNEFEVDVYYETSILFRGVLSLLSVDSENFRVVLLSKVSLLIDELGDKNLRDIKSLEDIDFNYEETIRTHINANYLSSDETPYQFPFIFYSTYFTPPVMIDDSVDKDGRDFLPERAIQNYMYLLNNTNFGDNDIFFHQIPLAYYIKPVVEAILADAGWTLSGTFFERDEIKRIIMPYVGDNDIYDESTYCSDGSEINIDGTCSTGSLKLKTTNFLPEMTQTEFLTALINTFNLYFTISLDQKTIAFETYNDLFLNKTSPINLDNIIDSDSVKYVSVENNNPSIRFTEVEYNKVLGDGTIMSTASTNALNQQYKKLNTTHNIYDYLGDDREPIEIDFGQPLIKKHYIRNSTKITTGSTSGGDFVIFIPSITRQTPRDNNNMPFYRRDDDTIANNTEDTIRHDGLPALYYYYGISDGDFEQKTGSGDSSDWLWIFIDGVKTKIPFASPYAYTPVRNRINEILNNGLDEEKSYASGMQSIYLMMGDNYSVNTPYSLVLSEQANIYPTLYNFFHEEKYRRYTEGYVLEANIKLSILNWNKIKMHVPLIYNKQIYSLIAIDDYDVVNEQARIRLIKQ